MRFINWSARIAFIWFLAVMVLAGGAQAAQTQASVKRHHAIRNAHTIVLAQGGIISTAPAVVSGGTTTPAAPTDPCAPPPAAAKKCPLIWDPLGLCGALTGNVVADAKRVVQRLKCIGKADMNYAILSATAAGTNGSKIRLQCLMGIQAAIIQFSGDNIKDANGNVVPKPDPALITLLEEGAELVDNLSPQGSLMTSCAGAAQLTGLNTLAAINGIITGAAGLAAIAPVK